MLLPFWTSFLVRAFAWIVLLGRNGVVNQLLLSLGIVDRPANLLYGFGSVLVGMVHALLPLAVLTMLSVMENIDRDLPRAAATLGACPGTAFWRIYFPLSLPGVAAAAIMVFVTAIGFFIVPALSLLLATVLFAASRTVARDTRAIDLRVLEAAG